MKHKIGKPIYHLNDIVCFDLTLQNGEVVTLSGEVLIIDAYGTFEQNKEPSYDVLVEDWQKSGTQMFVKHVRESNIKYKVEVSEND